VLTYEYQVGLHEEHKRIMVAIAAKDPDGAREAMRDHLSRSQDRYRTRVAEQGREH
jgi:GntR family transcriptional repressor for pyruvate dehydrogenase complex